MTSERYEKIGQLFHAALELPAESRMAFLSAACGVDVDLRKEVESLLEAHDKAGDFATAPPAGVFAAWLAGEAQAADLSGTIGAYEVLAPIGRGGMGEVYLAHDTRLGRKVAVKVLQAPLTSNAEAVRRFEQEARAASSLNHPNIVTIYEIGDFRDRRFIAMEYVEGRSVAAMVGPPMDATTLAKLGAQLARALVVAHAAGIVHRDIKPENVIVREDGYVKVLDFGLARLARLPTVEDTGTITNPNLLLGTPRYMSPEQARGETASAASDVFSLAVVLYELATGRHPFEAESTLAMLHSIASSPATAPLRWVPDLPPVLDRLLMRMLDKSAAGRPSASQVEAELSAFSAGSSAARTPSITGAAERRTHNLPPQRTALVGRSAEVASVKDLLLGARVRQLTLTGPGGTGKTRLAIQVAEELVDHFDGVGFVNLAPLTDSGLVASAVAHALGIRESGDLTLVKAIAEHLRSLGRALLVIDNFEQVSDAAPLVQELLDACPGAAGTGDEPRRAPHLRRAGVPGAAPAAADAGRAVLAIDAHRVRVGRAFRSARCRRQAGLRADVEECRRGRRNLPPARRAAARDRAGGGAHQDPAASRSPDSNRSAARSPDRRRPRSPGAPADAPPDHQVELRPVAGLGTEALSPPVGVHRRLHAGRSGSGLQRHRGSRRGRPRRHHRPRGQQPAGTARVGRRRAAVPDAGDVPRVRARAAPRARRGVVNRTRARRVHAGHRRGGNPRDESGRARGLAARMRRRARQLPRRGDAPDCHGGRGVGAATRRRPVPVLGAARSPHRRTRNARENAGHAWRDGRCRAFVHVRSTAPPCWPTSSPTRTPPKA